MGWYFVEKEKALDLEATKSSTRDRFLHRLKYSYRSFDRISTSLMKAVPVFFSKRRLRGRVLRFPARIGRPFALSLPYQESDDPQLPETLAKLDIDLVRMVISSETGRQLPQVEERVVRLSRLGIKSLVSLQQRRSDVTDPKQWEDFIQEVFSRLNKANPYVEIGTAWNLPGKGVYDHQEYLQLAHVVFSAAESDSSSLIGPGMAGFRSALYPSLLKLLPFDRITFHMPFSPEDDLKQARIGKKYLKNLTRLKAVVETCSQKGKGLWITDLYGPMPAGKDEHGLLVQFLVQILSTGCVEKIFLPWQTAVGTSVFKILKSFLEDSIFEGRLVHPEAEIFVFCKKAQVYAVGWTDGKEVKYTFPGKLKKIIALEGDEIPLTSPEVALDSHPRYVVFEKD